MSLTFCKPKFSWPASLDEAKSIALENSKQIEIGIHRSQAIQERISETNSKEFFPRLQLVAESGVRNNTDGISSVDDKKVLLQFQYSLNAGMAGLSAVKAAEKDLAASVSKEVETRDLVQEQVAIAWRNLGVARQNKEILTNQVRIAAKFLDMAFAERKLGRRSLLDVLTAEVSLINALSDLVSTEVDADIAALTLLQTIGKLDLNSFDLSSLDSIMPIIPNKPSQL